VLTAGAADGRFLRKSRKPYITFLKRRPHVISQKPSPSPSQKKNSMAERSTLHFSAAQGPGVFALSKSFNSGRKLFVSCAPLTRRAWLFFRQFAFPHFNELHALRLRSWTARILRTPAHCCGRLFGQFVGSARRILRTDARRKTRFRQKPRIIGRPSHQISP